MKSNNKVTLFLVFLLFTGILYANEAEADAADDLAAANDADAEIVKTALPKNTITIDVGQTVAFLLATGMVYAMDPSDALILFGIAAQYERQIVEKASAALRFEYGLIENSSYDMNFRIHALSAEGHGRFYPMQTTPFFLGLTLGYAVALCDFSTPEDERKPVGHYFKIGGKLGYRIYFNKPGGFVLEPSLGFNFLFGARIKPFDDGYYFIDDLLNSMYDTLVRSITGGGPRFSLSLGYRF